MPNACSTCQWTCNACGSGCGAASATGVFVLGLLPKRPGQQRPSVPVGDPGSGVFTNAFIHSLSWRPGFSHYGPVGPEWTRHAERWQAAVPPVSIRRTRMAGAFSEVLFWLLPGDGHHFPHDTAEDKWPCTADAEQRSTTIAPRSRSAIEPVGNYVLPSQSRQCSRHPWHLTLRA